jgi:hypothetical protein
MSAPIIALRVLRGAVQPFRAIPASAPDHCASGRLTREELRRIVAELIG